MKYYENGFYLEQNADKTRYEITDEYWQELLDQQSQGKEITTGENGKPIAIEHISTPQELAETELYELENWFTNYDLQVKQYERATRLGETFDKSIELLDNEARDKAIRIKELRKLLEG